MLAMEHLTSGAAGTHFPMRSRCVAVVIALALTLAACLGGGSPQSGHVPSADYLIHRGWKEIENRDLEAARETFEEVLSRETLESPDEGQALFGLAVVASKSGNRRKAIRTYERIVEDYGSHPDLLFHSLLNAADEYEHLGEYDSAEAALLKVLETAGDDREPSGDSSLMGNPYANHRHLGAFVLAEFYYERGRLVMASVFLSAARNAFPYQHFCGNALQTETFREVLLESKILEGLGRDSEALDVLFPHLCQRDSNLGLDRELSARAARLLEDQLPPEELREVVYESLDSIRPTDDTVVPTYEFRLMGHDIYFFPNSLTAEQLERGPTTEDLRGHLLSTDFFRELGIASLPDEGVKAGEA